MNCFSLKINRQHSAPEYDGNPKSARDSGAKQVRRVPSRDRPSPHNYSVTLCLPFAIAIIAAGSYNECYQGALPFELVTRPMNQDSQHLRLLAVFHYVVAGLAALFSLFPLLYTGMGAVFIWAARHPSRGQTGEPPPEALGWIFVAGGCLFFLLGLAMAICILIAGRSLAKRKGYLFAFVMACVECLFMPFGTVLGVFTIIVLSRESVKAVFSTAQTSV
jgi:hypothetical protein